MNTMFLDIYIKVSILIALTDVVLAKKSFQKNKTTGRFLGYACLGAAVVDISYLASILYDQYLCMSVMSSIHLYAGSHSSHPADAENAADTKGISARASSCSTMMTT